MNSLQRRLVQSLRGSAIALQDPRFHTRTIAPLRKQLAGVLETLRQLEMAHYTTHRAVGNDGRAVASLKSALRTRHLLPIVRRAKLVLKGYPGIEESLRLPHARADVKTHAAATKRIVKALRPHASELIKAGFDKDFLIACDLAARAMADRHASPDTTRNRRSIATRSIPAAIREGRAIVESIDAHVYAELGEDPLLVSGWRRAKRVPARIGRPKRRNGKALGAASGALTAFD